MRKISKTIVFFFILLFLILGVLDYLYTQHAQNLTCDKPQWTFSKKNTNYDYIIIGSSRAENTIDANTINDSSGLYGINIGHSGSALAENYATLMKFLQNGNKTKSILISIDEWGLITPDSAYSYPFHEYYFFPFLNNPTIDSIVYDNVPTIKYFIWKYIPFIKYAEFNHIYKMESFFINKCESNFEKTNGSNLLSEITYKPVLKKKIKNGFKLILNKKSLNYFYLILNACKTYNIKPLLYTAPIYHEYLPVNSDRQTLCDTIKNITLRNRITYMDFANDSAFYSVNNFKNETHLNKNGALVFSKMLSDSLKKYLPKRN